MTNKRLIAIGTVSGLLVWLMFIVSDFIDEIILDTGVLIGLINFVILPFIMLIVYRNFYLKNDLHVKDILTLFSTYYVVYLLLWYVVFYFEDIDKFIPQHHQKGIIDLNGVEYTLYGFSTLFFFTILCLIYHLIHHIFKKKQL